MPRSGGTRRRIFRPLRTAPRPTTSSKGARGNPALPTTRTRTTTFESRQGGIPCSFPVNYRRRVTVSRFSQGQSGNPKGRPKGSKDWRAEMRTMIEAKAPEIVEDLLRRAVVQKNLKVQLALLDKVVPPAKSMPISTSLKLAGGPGEQADAIVAALAAGRLTLDDAKALLDAIKAAMEIRDAAALADRVAELERKIAAFGGGGHDRS
nr:DUF5681 domain-containing protein [Azospirillum brasilense]